ncbi:MAG: hypothetical protein P1P77_17595, partial [Spirochaetaceae bacterium]|nr:hypothetical protein [Spirochaetaceae bacterium]
EMQESADRNNSLRLAEKRRQEELIKTAEEEQSALRRRIAELEDERETLSRRIAEQARELEAYTASSIELEDTNPAAPRAREEITVRWRLYGVVVGIVGETLMIEPLVDQIPPPGSQMRVMRSLGGDSMMQLADGAILEADRIRATAKISTDSGGSGSFGKPERDDLIYLTAP